VLGEESPASREEEYSSRQGLLGVVLAPPACVGLSIASTLGLLLPRQGPPRLARTSSHLAAVVAKRLVKTGVLAAMASAPKPRSSLGGITQARRFTPSWAMPHLCPVPCRLPLPSSPTGPPAVLLLGTIRTSGPQGHCCCW